MIINKKGNLPSIILCYPSGPQRENQRKRKERHVLEPCQTTKKVVKHESASDTNCNWHIWNGPQRFGNGLEELKIGGRIVTIQTIAL